MCPNISDQARPRPHLDHDYVQECFEAMVRQTQADLVATMSSMIKFRNMDEAIALTAAVYFKVDTPSDEQISQIREACELHMSGTDSEH